MDLHIPVLLGTVRAGRRSEWVARFVVERLMARPHVTTRLLDPREWPFGDLVEREWEMHDPSPRVTEFVAEVGRSDGFVIVSPEYNHGYPGALKNMLDVVTDEWAQKPFAIVGVGGISGGLRMTEQLRNVIPGLGGVCIPRSLPVPFVAKAFTEAGPVAPGEWGPRVDKVLDELAWYAGALKVARTKAQG